MRIIAPVRLWSIVALASAALLPACARTDVLTSPLTSNCPAASLASSGRSSSIQPGDASFVEGGCEHRAGIDIPLAQVIDLNDNGEVLGILNPTGPVILAVWSKAGTRTLTPPAGALSVSGADINNTGEVVGCATFDGGITISSVHRDESASSCHVIRWNAQGQPTDLGVIDPAAVSAHAYAINDAGVIVGDVTYAGGSHRAFVRSATGEVTLLESPGSSSAAVALNEAGDVTGWYTSGAPSSGPYRGFVWTRAGGTVDLGQVASRIDGTIPSIVPTAINESGAIIGTVWAWSATTPEAPVRSTSFLWLRAGGMRDIGTTSGLDAVTALNDAGEILGWGTLDGLHQPVTWATARPAQLAVRFGWSYAASQGEGTERQINSWNEVLDSYMQDDRLRNVVWTWNPERYR